MSRIVLFQSTRPSRASTGGPTSFCATTLNFNPQGPRGPRRTYSRSRPGAAYFNPQGPRGPRPNSTVSPLMSYYFNPQGPRGPRRRKAPRYSDQFPNFNPQGPRGPRRTPSCCPGRWYHHFNPQGPRGPRPRPSIICCGNPRFQSTRPSRASTIVALRLSNCSFNFNPQGPRGPRQQNYPTIPPHPPNFLCIMSSPPYFNLLHPFTQPIFTAFPLFFRCESPRHFMLAWHSHLV